MTNDEKYEYWIEAVRRSISDLKYEKRNLQKRMNENRQKMAEYRNILKRLEQERMKAREQNDEDHADAEPASCVG